MSYYNRYADANDARAILPEDGERLEFGVHRLVLEERTCPMWPAKATASADARYRNWIKGATKGDPNVIALLAHVKAGEVDNQTAATIVVRNSRPVSWVTQVEADAKRAALTDAWFRGEISLEEAQRRAGVAA